MLTISLFECLSEWWAVRHWLKVTRRICGPLNRVQDVQTAALTATSSFPGHFPSPFSKRSKRHQAFMFFIHVQLHQVLDFTLVYFLENNTFLAFTVTHLQHGK